MKVHDDIEKLVGYLREHPQSTTLAAMIKAGVLNSRPASDALQYGVRHGVIERIKRPGAKAAERVQYRLTGHPPPSRKGTPAPSFGALLAAWGIARIPPRLPASTSAQISTGIDQM